MIKGTSLLIALVTLIFGLVIFLLPASGEGLRSDMSQTWPSRTPTSSSEPVKSATPENSKPNTPKPAQPDPSATSLSPGQQATQDDTVIATPVVGNIARIPTALPCGVPPTVLALGPVSVRSGPSPEYQLLGRLAFSDVRIVVGRADSSPWWLIQFDELQRGWVSDQAVEVQGNISDTIVAASSSETGNTKFQESLWNPTPQPLCTPIGSNSASQLAEFPTLDTAISPGDISQEPAPIAAVTEVISRGPTPIAALAEDIAASVQSGDADQVATLVVLTEPLQSAERSTGSLNWLPIAGLLLIIAGAGLLLLQSRRTTIDKD